MNTIVKVVLGNFKRFKSYEIDFDSKLNVLIGDNETGKSSILQSIDITLSGSRSKVEAVGLEALFNNEVISTFLSGTKKYIELPILFAEVWLSDQGKAELNGGNNSKSVLHDGIRFECKPIDDYSAEIQEILKDTHPNFPFEYYSIKFTAFSGDPYTGFRRPIKHVLLDSSLINNDYATREYTKSIYNANVSLLERNKNENSYRKNKDQFEDISLKALNDTLKTYKFAVRTNAKSNLQSDLIITEENIPIESKGKGRQCFIKTEFALRKNKNVQALDLLLLEEPENHLSHRNMRKLINSISESSNKQLIITTHNSLISTRLDLRNAIFISGANKPISLKNLPVDTAKFFMKAPDNNVLEYVLSEKVILVEGDAEFILIDALYGKSPGNPTLEKDGVHVISIGGTSFKRYLDIAKLLEIKTAVIRDNDGDYQKKCVDSYKDYVDPAIGIFADKNKERSTFEICFYEDNQTICNDLFAAGRVKLTVLDYMLSNKADVAFELLDKKETDLKAPSYISEAIAWIKE